MAEQDSNRIEVVHGEKRAVFVRDRDGWRPDWFYLGDRPMLRFKDHEWLSIGHVHPTHAEEAKASRARAEFRGRSRYGATEVAWTVVIRRDKPSGGFLVETSFRPAERVELLEAYSTFETPYDYDGTEHTTSILGMNPVEQWEGNERKTPPQWRHPAWFYAHPRSARITAPCMAPLLCHIVENPDGSRRRCTTVVGDWSVCKVKDVFVTPTRRTSLDPDEVYFTSKGEQRGYKFIVGALNWSSAFVKDPNVLFGPRNHRQRVVIDYADEIAGGTLDAMALRAWERAAAFDLPGKGTVKAYERAKERDVSWQAAVDWLRGVYVGTGHRQLFDPEQGIRTYAEGSRPKAAEHYTWSWWSQWSGPLHYRAMLQNDAELAEACERHDEKYAEFARSADYFGGGIAIRAAMLPSLWWAHGPGRNSPLAAALRHPVQAGLEGSVAENDQPQRVMDAGAQACLAEGLLLAGELYGEQAMADQGLRLVDEFNAKLDGAFWEFNMGRTGNLTHGGQTRPLGHGHAALANILAYRQTGRLAYREAALRFARYLVGICYATHNGSGDPDFDWRGWANGSIAGRDQIAEFPPWETINSLLCVAAMLEEIEPHEAFYDVLWYIARTGLAAFPAARTVKRILDQSYQVKFVKREKLASETDFYDNVPYLAYENPHDQTLIASYQGSDCVLGELVFGEALATASDDRLGVLVPAAANFDGRTQVRRNVHLWNPTKKPIEATVMVTWPDGTNAMREVHVTPREVMKLTFER